MNNDNITHLFMGRDPSTGDWQEWMIQAYIIQEARRDGYFIEGDQNQAKRGYLAATRAKACGMQAGTPDIRVLLNGGRIVWIELKKRKGKLSPQQVDWHYNAVKLGHQTHILYADTPIEGFMRFTEGMNYYRSIK